MKALYTISSADGLYRSQHPEEPAGSVAHLYHHDSYALEQIAHADDPARWSVKEVQDEEAWLESLLKDGFTHLYEKLAENVTRFEEILPRLTSLRAWRVGMKRYE